MTDYETPTLCYECGAVVYRLDMHQDWHRSIATAFESRDKVIEEVVENTGSGFKAAREAIDELGDSTVHAFKARDVAMLRLFDVLLGKNPRARYKWPQTPEEREEIEAILRDLGIDKDVSE
ncbi:hypothetical protein ICV35_25045 [Rhodococcus ruber]|uniref:hypothetical protein n=1 Tax=Rhodococcus ruber TaxID=1830 RepID=UPI00177BD836|nr:hypothetical protein [Rhodococcus ruber]MBD8056917.1 hypothetical protein [Rhodococcus ruber]